MKNYLSFILLLTFFTVHVNAQNNLDVDGNGLIRGDLSVNDDLRVGDTTISSSGKVYLIDQTNSTTFFGKRSGTLELWDSDFQLGIFPNPGVNEFDRKIELRANQNVATDRQPIMNMYNSDEKKVFTVDVQSNGHAMMELDGAGLSRIHMDTEGSASAPYIELYDNSGASRIKLDTDVGGDSRITTDELLINGGSDLAEHFDVSCDSGADIPAGLIVAIDPANPGKLIPTTSAYDKGVAGVISGANGVEAGMMMGQTGTIADGDYPIALVGRVFVKANTQGGEIKPGDFLTSSDIRGEAMRVKKAKKAKGAVIGKALTSIDENGFVLVLVNLQ